MTAQTKPQVVTGGDGSSGCSLRARVREFRRTHHHPSPPDQEDTDNAGLDLPAWVTALVEAHVAKEQRRADLHARRAAGLEARHRQKLHRLDPMNDRTETPTP